MRIVPGFLVRTVAGETIVVPTREAARRLSGLAALNETGLFLFELLRQEQTEESLIEAMTAEFDVDRQTAARDVAQFLLEQRL